MARRPRLYDPRTGHPLTQGQQTLLARRVERYVVTWEEKWRAIEDRLEGLRQKRAIVRWQRRAVRARERLDYWQEVLRRLREQVERVVFEYQMKMSYDGREKKHLGSRVFTNVHMRTTRQRSAPPTDREIVDAYTKLVTALRPPKGWEYAIHSYRNDRLRRDGTWHRGPVTETVDQSDLGWIGNILIGGNLSADDVEIQRRMVIGEIEE